MPKRGEVELRKEEGRLSSMLWRGGGCGAKRGEAEARRGEAKRGRVEVEAWLKPSRGSGEAGVVETRTR